MSVFPLLPDGKDRNPWPAPGHSPVRRIFQGVPYSRDAGGRRHHRRRDRRVEHRIPLGSYRTGRRRGRRRARSDLRARRDDPVERRHPPAVQPAREYRDGEPRPRVLSGLRRYDGGRRREGGDWIPGPGLSLHLRRRRRGADGEELRTSGAHGGRSRAACPRCALEPISVDLIQGGRSRRALRPRRLDRPLRRAHGLSTQGPRARGSLRRRRGGRVRRGFHRGAGGAASRRRRGDRARRSSTPAAPGVRGSARWSGSTCRSSQCLAKAVSCTVPIRSSRCPFSRPRPTSRSVPRVEATSAASPTGPSLPAGTSTSPPRTSKRSCGPRSPGESRRWSGSGSSGAARALRAQHARLLADSRTLGRRPR